MSTLVFREANNTDIDALAEIRAINSGTKAHWARRIQDYTLGLVNPQKALRPRVIYIAADNDKVVGFIAGHLTERFACDGELQWIDTVQEYRGRGVASHLVRVLAKWFTDSNAYKICVDPGNAAARSFYTGIGAEALNDHWLFWPDIRKIL